MTSRGRSAVPPTSACCIRCNDDEAALQAFSPAALALLAGGCALDAQRAEADARRAATIANEAQLARIAPGVSRGADVAAMLGAPRHLVPERNIAVYVSEGGAGLDERGWRRGEIRCPLGLVVVGCTVRRSDTLFDLIVVQYDEHDVVARAEATFADLSYAELLAWADGARLPPPVFEVSAHVPKERTAPRGDQALDGPG